MNLTSRALVLLSAQRYFFESRPDEREQSIAWLHTLDTARSTGELVVLVQWDGPEGSDHETFSRGWTLYPDFRAEAGEVLLRATAPDAFAGSGLEAELRGRAVRELHLLALSEAAAEQQATAQTARELGFEVQMVTPEIQPAEAPLAKAQPAEAEGQA